MTRPVTPNEIADMRERLHRWAVWRSATSSGGIGPAPVSIAPFMGGSAREQPRMSVKERYQQALQFPKQGERVKVAKRGRPTSTVTPIDVAMRRIDQAVLHLPQIYQITLMVEFCNYLRAFNGESWDQETKAARLGIKARTFRDRLHIAIVVLCRSLNHHVPEASPRRPLGVFL